MKSILLITILFTCVGCSFLQNALPAPSCSEKLTIRYEESKYVDNKLQDASCTVIFESGFNDTLEIYVDDKLLRRDFFETDDSMGYTGKGVEFNNDGKSLRILRIKSVTRERCMEITVDPRYKVMYIDAGENGWVIFYANSFTEYE